jgi:hypothetical protein
MACINEEVISKLDDIAAEDIGGRGMSKLRMPGSLQRAAEAMSVCKSGNVVGEFSQDNWGI